VSSYSGSHGHEGFDAVFVGGGVIGLAAAWRAAQAGARVCVLERAEPPAGATNVAAGMLAPVGELSFGEPALLAMMLTAARLWPEFVTELEEASGEGTGYRRNGALVVALDRDEAGELRRRHELQQELGLETEWLTARQCRELEPGLATSFGGGVLAPGDASVDPRRLVSALAAALREAGGELRTGTEAIDGLWDGERLVGVRTAPTNSCHPEGDKSSPSADACIPVGDKRRSAAAPSAETRRGDDSVQTTDVYADAVVLCNGAWAGQTPWLPPEARPPVRPVKGEVIELKPREAGPPVASRNIASERIYLVPRDDGRLVIGATQEERGFDTTVTAGGVHELLREAYRVLPEIAEMELAGMIAGLRPGSPDNLPIVGRGAVEGLVLASGHFRNGILLAPLTAVAVAATLAGTEPPAAMPDADPSRVTLVTQRATRVTGKPTLVAPEATSVEAAR
jgi:glycine oxidase